MTSHGGNTSKCHRNNHRCDGDDDDDSSSSTSSSSSSASNVNRDRVDNRRKRHNMPYGSFAYALKSTRLQERPVNLFEEVVFGNPHYGNKMRLFCRTGWHLAIDPNGRVHGIREDNNPYTMFEIMSAGQRGHVFIRSMQTNLYIAFNKKGLLYGERRNDSEYTVWMEELLGLYNTYLSRGYAHLGWYLAMKKSGKPKKGNRTAWGQKAIQFLPRRPQQ